MADMLLMWRYKLFTGVLITERTKFCSAHTQSEHWDDSWIIVMNLNEEPSPAGSTS